jgi:hypothetical protein
MTDETAKPPELLAIGLIQDAKAYVESARQLEKLTGGAVRFLNPMYFLLCQAIELLLKAHLAASGVPNRTLRKRIGHNIEKSYSTGTRGLGILTTSVLAGSSIFLSQGESLP